MKVAIEALVDSGRSGGIEQYLIGLLNGLSQLERSEEEYVVVNSPRQPKWFYAGPSASIRSVSFPAAAADWTEGVKRLLGPARGRSEEHTLNSSHQIISY